MSSSMCWCGCPNCEPPSAVCATCHAEDPTRLIPVDWAPFDPHPESICYCKCDAVFLSHAKIVGVAGGLRIIARKHCPVCKSRTSLVRVSSPREKMTLG